MADTNFKDSPSYCNQANVEQNSNNYVQYLSHQFGLIGIRKVSEGVEKQAFWSHVS